MTALYDRTGPDGHRSVTVEDDASLGELFGQLGSDVSELMSTHVQLAVTEVRDDLQQRAKSAGVFGGAGVAALFGLLLLSFAAAWGLAEIMPTGVAFLIVGLVYVIVAAVLYVIARKQMEEAEGAPQTIETIQEDVQWAKRQVN